MIAALFALLFLGGGGSPLLIHLDTVIDNVKAEVPDADRRKAAVDVLKAAKSDRKAFGKQQKDNAKAVGEIFKDPNATEANADPIWDDFFQDLEAYHTDVLDRRDELREHLTEDEWTAVFAPDAED